MPTHFVGARLGLLGNPSDGFGGKTLAVLIKDFWATVRLRESPDLRIIPNPRFDPFAFDSLEQLSRVASEDGYYGGVRLLYATCKRFYSYCQEHSIDLPDTPFAIEYDTNIPRQVGLGGSSAIVAGGFKCLMDFFGLTEQQIPLPLQPHLVLSVETEELDIQAGLQDRVVQTYGGLVYMDFKPEYVQQHGYGAYESLPVDLLPPLYVAYLPHSTTCSGKLHNPMRDRYQSGEPAVIAAMQEFAHYTDLGCEALKAGDTQTFGELMNRNFDLRRQLYGDEAIGEENLEMIMLARRLGLPAKFAGSGGAIVGTYEDEAQARQAQQAFDERGYGFAFARPASGDIQT